MYKRDFALIALVGLYYETKYLTPFWSVYTVCKKLPIILIVIKYILLKNLKLNKGLIWKVVWALFYQYIYIRWLFNVYQIE